MRGLSGADSECSVGSGPNKELTAARMIPDPRAGDYGLVKTVLEFAALGVPVHFEIRYKGWTEMTVRLFPGISGEVTPE